MGFEADSLLIVLPVAFRSGHGTGLLFEKQACNGLEKWAANFKKVVVACPIEPEGIPSSVVNAIPYIEVDDLPSRDRMELIPLPWAYGLATFWRTYRTTRAILADAIRRSQYLSFAIGGLIGDWGSVAAFEAIRQDRPYSIWTDRVESKVIRSSHLDTKGPKKLYHMVRNNAIFSPLMRRLEHHVIGKSNLGLFHGRDCFDAYSPHCKNPHLVHDIHLKPEDRIHPLQLSAKIERVRLGEPLRLLYVGRLAEMKGPFDWIKVMADLRDLGLTFQATWIGDGPLLDEMRREIDHRGLQDRVELKGFVGDRGILMQAMRDSDLFVFCHKTPESPRCLIEALMSGTPIIGYDRPYPRDLLGDSADRLLVPLDDAAQLARRIEELDKDRAELAQLIRASDEHGSHFSDEAVFRHRSELIKKFS